MTRQAMGVRHARGVVSLEFVLMLPFLLMVLIGIIDTSLLLCDKAVITNASREAARAGVVLRVPMLTPTQIANVASTYTQNSLITGGTATTPTITVTQANGTTAGTALTVTVTYTYSGLVLGSAFSALTGPVTISASSVMLYE
ncbi:MULTISPECIES: TadE/TadG family type IV pilus assembly protein [unclassified Burkholderia]|uniref:TadE/TadG family type IV pilus assembly protein n=1 Tax=unclassified Burkholderia TaxID=2613784 RepID=UPI0005CF84BD|nr:MULTISPECIES: TadE family protein [unclassified Burkholderia]RQR42672.1 pilus assembly protein [Burkholderia sp. Bp9131]RQR74729.1 pilus assembly protein [Burkholderia sp. Bp9015]RQR77885.1 pilus assembly protein [Burkholderia sp. Bp9011]RQR87882.1 pilus assembly protein [Burkholderia sp. Bp9010]RQS11655.1 pilus assembly protein [Burkholderia sp. Bp8991]